MTTKAYVSNRFPFLQMGDRVAFQDGVFETGDEELQALIEKSDFYGVHIHPRDGESSEGDKPAEPAPEPPAPTEAATEEESSGGRAHRGSRGSRY